MKKIILFTSVLVLIISLLYGCSGTSSSEVIDVSSSSSESSVSEVIESSSSSEVIESSEEIYVPTQEDLIGLWHATDYKLSWVKGITVDSKDSIYNEIKKTLSSKGVTECNEVDCLSKLAAFTSLDRTIEFKEDGTCIIITNIGTDEETSEEYKWLFVDGEVQCSNNCIYTLKENSLELFVDMYGAVVNSVMTYEK